MNPAGASHFGGFYERKIGAVKHILESFLFKNKTALSRDEMHTLLQEATSIVNATPLYGFSDDPNDPVPISPSTLLTLRAEPPPAPVSTSVADLQSYGKSRYKIVQVLADQFWKEWRQFYLSEITDRKIWKRRKEEVRVGNVVVITNKMLARNMWNLGLITGTVPGSDGLVRRVTVRVCPRNGRAREVEKAIHDLVILC
jgi:hypothetical protein